MTRLLLLWIVLGAAAFGLHRWDARLERDETAARAVESRIGRLIRADERTRIAPADLPVSHGPRRFDRTPVSVGRVGAPKFLYRPDAEGIFRVRDRVEDVRAAEDPLRIRTVEELRRADPPHADRRPVEAPGPVG
ncbi:MAG: hypothetical protein ACF8XB_15240, partial [Planctomycetota bacterium JB042]